MKKTKHILYLCPVARPQFDGQSAGADMSVSLDAEWIVRESCDARTESEDAKLPALSELIPVCKYPGTQFCSDILPLLRLPNPSAGR